MHFVLTPEQEEWRAEVRQFLREKLTPAVKEELGLSLIPSASSPSFYKDIADKGWIALNWPEEHGGLAKSAVEQIILNEEFEYAGAPALPMTATGLAPMIIRYGSEGNKRTWLPPIKSGEVTFALGYSEPDAGTDLANLRTRAVLDGDEWVVDGQKIWNSEAHLSTHEWLAVRTDPESSRHRGISVLIVPLDSPGITVDPIWTWGDERTNLIFFDEVRVPRENLIGEANQGWSYIVGALTLERVTASSTGSLQRLFDETVDFAVRTVLDGAPIAARPEVQLRLAELATELEVARLIAHQAAAMIDAGEIPVAEAAMQKVVTTELRAKIADYGMQLADLYGQLRTSDGQAPLDGRMEQSYRLAPMFRFAAGTNEVMRTIIAEQALGLPRG